MQALPTGEMVALQITSDMPAGVKGSGHVKLIDVAGEFEPLVMPYTTITLHNPADNHPLTLRPNFLREIHVVGTMDTEGEAIANAWCRGIGVVGAMGLTDQDYDIFSTLKAITDGISEAAACTNKLSLAISEETNTARYLIYANNLLKEFPIHLPPLPVQSKIERCAEFILKTLPNYVTDLNLWISPNGTMYWAKPHQHTSLAAFLVAELSLCNRNNKHTAEAVLEMQGWFKISEGAPIIPKNVYTHSIFNVSKQQEVLLKQIEARLANSQPVLTSRQKGLFESFWNRLYGNEEVFQNPAWATPAHPRLRLGD